MLGDSLGSSFRPAKSNEISTLQSSGITTLQYHAIMSVPYLLNGQAGNIPASQRIPVIAKPFVSEKAERALDLVERFVEEECIPAEAIFSQQLGQGASNRFNAHPPVIEDLKRKAKELGLWNMFLPKNHFKESAGFSNSSTA
ncbi:acyl-CoA dehydrogenase family member 11 [Metarhizium acridum CQMa 102]|uniref:Acyl-CoA dehydrogenase family member 11 n=1 Tax=Metarhizium acridum (strain CQMa 102) TaxID=655827 RepID=E9ECU0_METAQ|nr:acyl-CoA dehydrogenase family member 11 [Metarhizium acridum CQMa 102]EFY86234.1 acyl-CoA dehydrogenase family member 11 [Metarhizium acridum CQMa 102]